MRYQLAVCVVFLYFVSTGYCVTRYVAATSTNPVPPYTNWITAAKDIYAALAISTDGDVVVASNGTYWDSCPITNAVTLQSLNGYGATTVRTTVGRAFYLGNTGAVVEGFTIFNARESYAAGALVDTGLIRRCRFESCQATNGSGGGVWVSSGGRVEQCIFVRCIATANGGAIACQGGSVDACWVENNETVSGDGGGVFAWGGHIRNVVALNNSNRYASAKGGGLLLYQNATAECCTVVDNFSTYGGGVYNDRATIRNSIIVSNRSVVGPANYAGGAIGTNIIEYCCLPETPEGVGNITNSPAFVSYATRNFRLTTDSPCRDAGTNATWMSAAADYDGNVRLINGRVDMGAYEFQIAYVAPGGSHTAPFDTWAKAATNIQAAVNVISNHYMVLVSNGVYRMGSELSIDKPIVVKSVNGRGVTAIDGEGTHRCVRMTTNAVLDGFTVTNGYSGDLSSGAGILGVGAVTIVNCSIVNNRGAGYGGGLNLSTAYVANCEIKNNESLNYRGGGAYVYNSGEFERCVIQSNRSWLGGGGIQCYFGSGRIRNCLIANNAALSEGGGGVDIYNGSWSLENCTIVDNSAVPGYPGGVDAVIWPQSSASNCIIMFNSPSNYDDSVTLEYCCANPLSPGPGNINADPLFVNRPARNYRLTLGSPCYNAGTNAAWMATGLDLAGHPRLVDGTVDMGAYELTPIHYVATNGAHIWPFATWADAATNLQAAIDAAETGETVLVGNGVFVSASEVSITKPLTVSSVNGATATVINGAGTYRCLAIYTSAVVRGFTLTNGFASTVGGGVYLAGGAVLESCVVQRCWATEAAGGVYVLSNGYLRFCTLVGNTTIMYNAGAVYLRRGGSLSHCVIVSNAAMSGGAVYCDEGGSLTNCLVWGNRARSGDGGGVVFSYGGRAENCTIAANTAATNGGGVWCSSGGTLINCLIYGNTALNGSNYFINTPGASFTNCCTAPAIGSGCVSNDPRFVSAASGNFRLKMDSPCLNAGVNLPWMAGAADLDGAARVSDSVPDIGAYEFHWIYVSTNGAGLAPFDTWAKAVSDPFVAISAALSNGYPVLITNGFFVPSAELVVNRPIVIRSVNGADVTKLSGAGVRRVFNVSTNAVIEGLTITNGYAPDLGGGLVLDYGATLRSSCVVGCRAAMFGGGIFATRGSRIEGCTIAHNRANNNMGGGVYLTESALMDRCLVVSNIAPSGGGLCDQGGTTRNSFILYNTANFGGGVYLRGSTYGTVESSTICSNYANSGGGIYDEGGGTVRNCIVYFNVPANHVVNGAVWQHNCSVPTHGMGCITNDPLFVGGGNFHLTFASPCLNAGTNQPWMLAGLDYDRGPRLVGPSTDIGADEVGLIHFVRLLGSWTPTPPYTSWDTAATNIQDALNVCGAGDMVVVTDGVHVSASGIIVTQSVWLTSVNGPALTTINGQGVRRCLEVWTNAVVTGFTFSNGFATTGGGLYLTGGGYVDNCVFVTNRAGRWGAGAFISGTGVIANSRFIGNSAMTNDAGAVYFQRGGTVLNCVVVSNLAQQGGAFFFEYNGLARNCLIIRNRTRFGSGGGALFYYGGRMENCTVCDNVAMGAGGGLYSALPGTSVVENTIVYFNTAGDGSSNHYGLGSQHVTNLCTAPPLGAGCVSSDPRLADRLAGDYRLNPLSPCVDAGFFKAWMSEAKDLDGQPRLRGDTVDIGAYEVSVFYVATNGSHVPPYSSWASAATNPMAIPPLARRYSLVWVGPGTYVVTQQVAFTGSVAMVSTAGAGLTTIRGNGNTRCLYLGYGDCVVDGFTIENGATNVGDGGGVHISRGGTLRNCVIRNNRAQLGAGVFCFASGLVDRCVLYGNVATNGYGGGVYLLGGGELRNCLVYSNWGIHAGGVYLQEGTSLVRNCTVVKNVGRDQGGGIRCVGNTRVENTIVWSNVAPADANWLVSGLNDVWSNCCTAPAIGTNCVTNDPQFVSLHSVNCHLQRTSPCIDAGLTLPWMAASVDLDGAARVSGAAPDMGAYEFHWVYVATNGANIPPYDTWAKAAADLQTALNAAESYGYPMLLTNGVYTPTSQLSVNRPITISSVNGPNVTTISGGGAHRVLYVSTNAIIQGLTISNGASGDWGGGVYAQGGALLQTCRIVNCTSETGGGGAFVENARLEDCELTGNVGKGDGGGGAYLWGTNGILERCIVSGNSASVGGGIRLQLGTVRNCLVVDNISNEDGGGVIITPAGSVVIESSTICSNSAGSSGGGICDVVIHGSATVLNCIVYYNFPENYGGLTGAMWRHCCTTPSKGSACVTNPPAFTPDGGYHLTFYSPCLNAGTNQPWMTTGFDMDRRSRITFGITDIGADELAPHYVRLLGTWTSAPPYETWDTAATNIQDALNVCFAGDMVIVTDGVYVSASGILVTQIVRLTSVNGPAVTAINGQGVRRCLEVWTNSVVSGFTFSNGFASTGGGVYLTGGGYIDNCVFVTNCASQWGGGAFISGTGVIANSRFIGNSAIGNDAGAVYFEGGGAVLNCVVVSNLAQQGGGFFFESGGLARNCLITHNRARYGHGGGALFYYGGRMENCTVCDNTAQWWGGGLFADVAGRSVVLNTIVYFNSTWLGMGSNHFGFADFELVSCCTLPAYGSGCVASDPLLVNRSAGDYRLGWFSPCVDAGTNDAWMAGAVDLDNDQRIWGERVDIGAYELPVFYVAKKGGEVPPYSSWATAAKNPMAIPPVVRRHSLVWVGAGTYVVTQQVAFTGSVAMVSTYGAGATVIQGDGNTRCLYLGYGNCLVDGFTIENGVTNFGDGGGVQIWRGGTLRNSVIRNNRAQLGAGVFCLYSGLVDRCVLYGNVATNGYGGGAYLVGGGELRNCVVYSNWGIHAGGVYLQEGTSVVRNCTVVKNVGRDQAGGIRCVANTRVENTIVWSNVAPADANYLVTAFNDIWSNCCTVPAIGTNCVTNDPQFVSLASCDFHLTVNSPCADAGLSALGVTNDFDGMMRPLDGDRDALPEWDIGAYELINPYADTDGNGMPDGWEYQYFGWPVSGADPNADPDEDFVVNREEAIADTHPFDATSRLAYLAITNIYNEGEWRTIQFWSSSNRVYTLQWSTNGVQWLNGAYVRQPGNGAARNWKETNAVHVLDRILVELP